MHSRIKLTGRAVVLCYMAKGDPREGHLRPEMVSLPAPVPRRDINSERRSLSFLFYLREGIAILLRDGPVDAVTESVLLFSKGGVVRYLIEQKSLSNASA